MGWAAYEAAKELGVPFAITPYLHKGQYGDGPADIRLYRQADAVIALLEPEKKFYLKTGIKEENIFVVGLAADIGKPTFTEELKQKHSLDGYKIVTFIGRKQKYKGVLELRKAAEKVWGRFPKTKFLFIGPEDKGCIIDAGGERVISAGGVIDIERKSSYINLSDIICLPSRFESFGIIVAEAWAFRKPVVVSDNEALQFLVEDGVNGFIVKIEPEDIAQRLIELLENLELTAQFGENGFEKYRKNYTPEIIFKKHMKIYKKISEKSRIR